MSHILEVENLRTEFAIDGKKVIAANGVSFYADAGEIVGIVGESGSGKSVAQLSVLKLISPPGEIVGGSVFVDGTDISGYAHDSEQIRKVRGGRIGMIFQEPMTSLNPLFTIGEQITESIKLHLQLGAEAAKSRAIELLGEVGITDAHERFDCYPHQFSGGMRQRIMIAIVIAAEPGVLVADEATTALDVTTQAQILEMLRHIVEKRHCALIIITHNMGIVARYADRIYVMYAGNVVEEGKCVDIFKTPRHPYSEGLLKAIPRLDDSRDRVLVPIDGVPPNLALRGPECMFLPRCGRNGPECKGNSPELHALPYDGSHKVACHYAMDGDNRQLPKSEKSRRRNSSGEIVLRLDGVGKFFPVRGKKPLKAVENVSFSIRKGETLGVVGESGCGKTTLAKTILRLYEPSEGRIEFLGQDITGLGEAQVRKLRSKMSFVFQDPFSSLDPRQTAGSIVGEPLLVNKLCGSKKEYRARVDEIFTLVGLDPALAGRVPHEFSGGQRQRIAIARALASRPEFLICDEPISALDVSIQAQVINLLEELQADLGLTYMFIAHDLSVVKHISDWIMVMYMGRVMEIADCEELYRNPAHPYTQSLLSAIPVPDPEIEMRRELKLIQGEISSLSKKTEKCVFFERCAVSSEKCGKQPALVDIGKGHYVSCNAIS
jgi:peptide/nickel transport system ATP-binding protein